MSEVRWVKISVSMFDDTKMKLIDQLPERDAVQNIWVRLIVLAGQTNAGGSVYLNEETPYSDEMLAAILGRPLSVVRLALETFKRLRMIEHDENGAIYLVNWAKHQNVDALERMRENTRLRVQRFREKQKAIDGGCNVTETFGNGTEKNRTEREKNNTEEADNTDVDAIIDYLNEKTGSQYRHSENSRKHARARLADGATVDDCKAVIDIKTAEWLDDAHWSQFLRPETLFSPSKFPAYLAAAKRNTSKQESERICGECGAHIFGTSTYCFKCGANWVSEDAQE